MFDLAKFNEQDAKRLGVELIKCSAKASDIREAAEATVRFLFENLTETDGNKQSLVLARLFLTIPLKDLQGKIHQTATTALSNKHQHTNFTKCLVLLATAGVEPTWNDISKSTGHQAIPLQNKQSVQNIPMISRMLTQFGLDLDAVLSVDPDALRQWQKTSLNAFHIPVAKDSPYIPAQNDFVVPYNVRSVLGCGGILQSSRFFSLILFSQTQIPNETANAFRKISEDLRTALDIGNMERSSPFSL